MAWVKVTDCIDNVCSEKGARPKFHFDPLGVVHNCQHLPISTESTNLGGGGGGEGASVLFLKC